MYHLQQINTYPTTLGKTIPTEKKRRSINAASSLPTLAIRGKAASISSITIIYFNRHETEYWDSH